MDNVNPIKMHEAVTRMYSWHNVASRTEKVYSRIARYRHLQYECFVVELTVLEQIERYKRSGSCIVNGEAQATVWLWSSSRPVVLYADRNGRFTLLSTGLVFSRERD